LSGFFGFIGVMNRFIIVFKVFWVKNRLQNRFLGQKNINPDFPVTTVAIIWAKQATHRCFFLKKRADGMLSALGVD